MKRLTIRINDRVILAAEKQPDGEPLHGRIRDLQRAANERLADYEDTGLTPEEIRELQRHFWAALDALGDSKMYVEAYKGKTDELSDKHWEECRQIALYDDELRRARELLQECYDALDLAEYPGLTVEIEEALDEVI